MATDQADEPAAEADRDGAESDAVKPWTIKGIAPEERNAAIAAAKRAKVPLGPWLSRAIRAHIKAERDARRVPVPVAQPDPRRDLADVERLLAAAEKLSTISGAPPPKGVQRLGYGLIRDGLRAVQRSARNGTGSDRSAERSDPEAKGFDPGPSPDGP